MMRLDAEGGFVVVGPYQWYIVRNNLSFQSQTAAGWLLPGELLMSTTMTFAEANALAGKLRENVARAVFGQQELITDALCCLLAGGHILMTGAPGLAKTTLVRVFARHLGVAFARVQFTPDLLPADIVGAEILNQDSGTGQRQFNFVKGPVFTNLLLADEINRASPRTQSALLEAMQERSVTVAGRQHLLPQPFMVFATQNPFEAEGTFPLPEAQLDRFLLHTLVAYPDADSESRILAEHAVGQLVGEQHGVIGGKHEQTSPEEVAALIAAVRKIHVDEALIIGIRDLVRSTRPEDELCPEDLRSLIWYGAGPRAGISLISVSRALAMLEGQETVRWEHVRRLAAPALRHRMCLTAQGMRDDMSADRVIAALLERCEEHHKNLARGLKSS